MLIRHLLGYLPAHLANALVGFGGVAVLTRLLEPNEYGRYSLALSTIIFVQQSLFTWLEGAIARRYAAAQANGDLADELASAYAAYAVVATGLAVIGAAVLIFAPIPDDFRTLGGLGLGVVITNALLRLGIESRRAAREVTRTSALLASHTLLGFLTGVAFILWTDMTSAGPIAGLLVGAVVVGLADVPFMLRRLKGGLVQPKRIGVMLSFGAAISLTLAFSQIMSVADRFLIAIILDEAATGVYAAGYGLANRPLDIVFVWAGLTMAPLIVAAFEQDGAARAQELAGEFGATLILICLPAATGIALVAEPLAGFMVGEAFREDAARVIPPIAFAAFMSGCISYYFHQSFTLTQRTGMMAAALAPAAGVNVALNLWWLPIYGVMGAVWATVAAYGVGLLIFIFLGRRLLPLPIPFRVLAQAGGACAVMALIVSLIPNLGAGALVQLLVEAAIGALVYGAAALVLDIAGCREWLRNLRNRTQSAGTP